MKKQTLLTFYICIFYLLVMLPTLQNMCGIFPRKILSGVEYAAPFPKLSFNTYLNCSFQKAFEQWYSRDYGLRDYLVRSENQLNYSLFNQINNELILGKENNLFERSYIVDYLAIKTPPQDVYSDCAEGLKKLQDYFEIRGVKLLFIIAPNKASIYPENIPDIYQKYKSNNKTIYEQLVPELQRHGVNYLDGHAFCAKLKKESRYPVFHKGGIHWNFYASFLFSQEIIKKISEMLDKSVNTIELKNIRLSKDPLYTDDDLARLANVWDETPFVEPSVYPYGKKTGFPCAYQPNVLFIGDSFMYTVLYWLNKYQLTDSRSEFCFYFRQKKIFNEQKELLSRDVIIIEANEVRVLDAGFGFVQAVLKKKVSKYCQKIKASFKSLTIRRGDLIKAPLTIKNTSEVYWKLGKSEQGTKLSYHVINNTGKIVLYDGARTLLPYDLAPGGEITLQANIEAPQKPGKYIFRFTMLEELVAWFDDKGAETFDMPVTVIE
jgi:hypothetical protein